LQDCIFCKIIRGEIPANVLYEDDKLMAFSDIHPLAPTHVLVIPKEHLACLDDLSDAGLAGELLLGIVRVADRLGIAGGYKVVTNCGEPAGQVVHHLHFHLLAGKKFVP
jgi:histidine triad (HIT) family protein